MDGVIKLRNKNIFLQADIILTDLNEYTLSWQLEYPSSVKIYYGTIPTYTTENKYLISSTEETQLVFILNTKERIYVLIEAFNGDKVVVGVRQIKLEGAHNFRDLGGYEGANGKKVKWGMLYRSDHLSELSEKDVEYLETLKIRSIVDFRSATEVSKQKDKSIANTKYYNLDPNTYMAEIAAYYMEMEKEKEKEELVKVSELLDNPCDVEDLMINLNIHFVKNDIANGKFKELIEIMKNIDNVPIVQHCRGGKDRTGFSSAIMLFILGVSAEVVVEDYLLTNEYRKERNKKRMKHYFDNNSSPERMKFYRSLIAAKKEYLIGAINVMISEYGSIDGYISNRLAINQEDIDSLRDLYLN
jgi:protein-tyrosine phosphatase